jgi:hypothetical protein
MTETFGTLLRVAATYCHPAADENAYDGLKRLARRGADPEMSRFKEELRQALRAPADVPQADLYREVQYGDGSAERFLRRLWHDLYPDEPVPGG